MVFPDETAVCNVASIILPAFVTPNCAFDFNILEVVVRHIVLSLNRVIENTCYPTRQARDSAEASRAIGIGIQGLADTFALMKLPFDSPEAAVLNARIAETIYFVSMDESCNLIRLFGVYPTFHGSPLSRGLLQIDHWERPILSERYDWDVLRQKVKMGVANALVTAYMPTAGTSLISGVTECFEPFPNRKAFAGQFTVTPRLLVNQLRSLGLWNEEMQERIIANGGSIQAIETIPLDVRGVYKTVWDIDPSVLIKMAADRGPFVCQSQSLSLYLTSPTATSVCKSLFQAWKLGLKTGLYHLRTKPFAAPSPATSPVQH
ncbi:hypothetical protein NMY22_g9623 [Coprinellus aureogranulatus]|nr:hypothetical protein NMY22_g9623 [Coprinellus aureogranulatus]